VVVAVATKVVMVEGQRQTVALVVVEMGARFQPEVPELQTQVAAVAVAGILYQLLKLAAQAAQAS
jgi:hypothetical protein